MKAMASRLIFGLLVLAGCAHSKIPMTTIDDTEENREILQIVKEYHKALESLDNYLKDNANAPDAKIIQETRTKVAERVNAAGR